MKPGSGSQELPACHFPLWTCHFPLPSFPTSRFHVRLHTSDFKLSAAAVTELPAASPSVPCSTPSFRTRATLCGGSSEARICRRRHPVARRRDRLQHRHLCRRRRAAAAAAPVPANHPGWSTSTTSGADGDTYSTNSLPDILDYRELTGAFADVAGYSPDVRRGQPRRPRAVGARRSRHRELLHNARGLRPPRPHAPRRG